MIFLSTPLAMTLLFDSIFIVRIILTENVKGLGQMGDVKQVKNGYGRNFLLPNSKAILATEENLKKLDELKKKREEAAEQELEQMKRAAEKLKDLKIQIRAKADEKGHLYASVNPENIAVALKEQGIEIDANYIEIPHDVEQPGKTKKLGEHQVLFKYNDKIKTEFTVEVVKES